MSSPDEIYSTIDTYYSITRTNVRDVHYYNTSGYKSAFTVFFNVDTILLNSFNVGKDLAGYEFS